MKECPLCGSPHDSIDGVIMHMRNSQDEVHANIHNQMQAVEHIQNAENDSVEVPKDTQNAEYGGSPPEGMFDEPSTGAELSDYSGDDEGDYVALPCGHEELHPDDIPEAATSVVCEVCGEKYGVSDV